MAEIFISYKKEDAARVARIVEALRAEHLDVWWDQSIGSGDSWRRQIHDQIEAAKVVCVVWSNNSVGSEWVQEEAEHGKQRGVLCPVSIDEAIIPIGFKGIQASNLAGWRGDRKDPAWRHFVESIQAKRDGRSAPERKPPKPRGPIWPVIASVLGALAALVTILGGLEQFGVTHFLARSDDGVRVITPAEHSAWAQLRNAGDCDALRDYVAEDPNAPFVREAEALINARRESQREDWQPFTQTLPVTGASSISASDSEANACAAARADAVASAEGNCSLYQGTLGEHRNVRSEVADAECSCRAFDGRWQCSVRTEAMCAGEARSTVTEERCARG